MESYDPEDLVECPYDKCHVLLRKRMQYHLDVCRKNHPEKQYQRCPFNNKHHIPKVEMPFHRTVCFDRNQHMGNSADVPTQVPHVFYGDVPASQIILDYDTQHYVPSEENWDTEISGGTKFNLVASGQLDSYTRTSNVVPNMRQPKEQSLVLQKSQPPGFGLPAASHSTSNVNSAVGGASSGRGGADMSGAWGGARGFGRGIAKPQSSQPVVGAPPGFSVQAPPGYSTPVPPGYSTPVPPGYAAPAPPRSSASSETGSGSLSYNSPRRPTARKATSTAAFSLMSLSRTSAGNKENGTK